MQATLNAVESFRRARLVDGVTSDDDKSAAVYRLDEICDLLLDSTSDVVREVVDYIAQRLEDRSPYVKQKALRLIKYVLPRTSTTFRREIQRYSTTMKALFHFRAPPDPLKGDAPSKSVREAAHEAVHALFNPEPPQGRMAKGNGMPSGVSSSFGDRGPRKMEGFGNTAPPRQAGPGPGASGWGNSSANAASAGLSNVIGFGSKALQQGLSMLTTSSSSTTRKLTSSSASGFDGPGDYRGSYKGPSIPDTMSEGRGRGHDEYGSSGYPNNRYSQYGSRGSAYPADSYGSRGSAYPADPYSGRGYEQGDRERGSGWEQEQYREDPGQREENRREYEYTGRPDASNGHFDEGQERSGGAAPAHQESGGDARPGGEAALLVEAATAPGGMRVQPSREILQEFVARAERLGGEDVAHALEWRLGDRNWQVRLKALCVLEALLRRVEDDRPQQQPQGSGGVARAVREALSDSPGAVLECLDSPQSSVRDKARRVLELLGVGKGPDQSASAASRGPQASARSAPPQSADFLPDLLDTSEAPASLGHAAGAGGEAGLGGGFADLLGGGGGGDSMAADGAPTEASASLFQGLAVSDAAPPAAAAAGASQDPFSGLEGVASPAVGTQTVGGRGGEALTPSGGTGAAPAAAAAQQPLGDLLGEDVDALFDGLSVSANDPQAVRPAATPSPIDKSAILNAYAVPTPLMSPGPALPGAMPPQGMAFPGMPVPPGMHPMPQGPAAVAAMWQQQQQHQMAMARAMQMGGYPGMVGGHTMGHMGGMPPAPGMGMPGVPCPAAHGGGMGGGMGMGALDPLDFTAAANQQAKAAAAAPSPSSIARKDDTHAFDFVSGHVEAARAGKKGAKA